MDDFNQGQNPMPGTPTNDVPVVEPTVEPVETPSEPVMPTTPDPMTPSVEPESTVPPAADQPVV